ncbi:MAG: ATP-binding protein [Cyclobacteriaceae bacterium]|nr:ATP-binding protein [Cyclobacteriaceae bacterium]
MIPRQAEKTLRSLTRQFRAVAVVGPRQSGKSTLVQKVFPRKPYVSLENPDERLFAVTDPRAFLGQYKNGAIIDEAQQAPELFSYLQQVLDKAKKDGLFILTGSNNFLLQQSISQTLAGRIGYLDLLPLTFNEIQNFSNDYNTDELLLNGCYPEIFDRNRNPAKWYPAYIRTYIERDVKQLKNIENTLLFNRFIQLCAGRTGQQLNIAALSNECGVHIRTVQNWLSILQSSYIVFLLSPHFSNFNKRIVKTPKLYFHDTGLACSLLGIHTVKELENSHFRGALFENYIIAECLKQRNNIGSNTQLYYWRDNKGIEIDLLADKGKKLIPVEIKSGKTFQENFVKNINTWNQFSGQTGGIVLYDGNANHQRSDKIKVANWRDGKVLNALL